jgi:hypothetical protein
MDLVQPTTRHFVPSNQPDVSPSDARTVDELDRPLAHPSFGQGSLGAGIGPA